MNTRETHVFLDCKSEMISLCKSLHIQQGEDWMTSLHCLEVKRNASSSDSLLILKSLLPSLVSTHALRNLVQLFLRKITVLMEEFDISKNKEVAKQTLNIVKDFWSLFSNQHVVITQKAFGRYSPLVYEVLPSLASVYIDLFITVHSSKSEMDKASKRLYSWLMFELNERCIKTALLEACQCTKAGARFLLPLLRKLLSKSPDNSSNLDYLLHFILLKRWTFVCVELRDLFQTHLAIKAPRNFPDWLTQHWPKMAEHLPYDKSLKGRRVSELLLELDQQTVEELIDVFSQCLWSSELVSEETHKQTAGLTDNAEQGMVGELFVIDKKGNDREEEHLADDIQPSKKKRKLLHNMNDQQHSTLLSNDVIDNKKIDESDIFMLSGLMDDSTSVEHNDSKKGGIRFRSCQENEPITAYISESDVDMSEEIGLQDRDYEQNLTCQEMQNNVEFAKVSEPPISVVSLSSQSYVVSSSEESNDVIIHSGVSSPTYSSSARNFSLYNSQPTKPIDVSILSDDDTGLTAHHSFSTFESHNRCRINSHSNILKSIEVEIVSDEDGVTDRNIDHAAQVGLKLSEIRKSMSDKRKSVTKDKNENAFHVKTRLRNKSAPGLTDPGKLGQGKISTPAKTPVRNLTGWLRESQSRLLKKQRSPQPVLVKDNEKMDCQNDSQPTILMLQERNKQSAVKSDRAVKTATSRSTKELTAADVFGKPLKTYSKKNNPVCNMTKAIEEDESHRGRYFLRTNCSHRLLNSETTCSTCSPKKITPTLEKLSHG